MDEQGRRSIGDRIAERLMKRVARRARVGLSADFLARFGIPDPWSEADGLASGGGSLDGMVFLSIKPYLARLRRLAWMRQHREERLANLAERYRLGGGLRALARLGMGSGASPRLGGLAGLPPISAGDMLLPRPPAPAVVPVEPVVAEAGPARRRARGSDVRVSDSPWLITPFRPARVVRGSERPSLGSRADVDRAIRVQKGADEAAPAAPMAARRDAGWATPPTARIGQRAPAVAPGPAGRVASFIEQEVATLRRSASGRRVLRSLVEVEQLDEAQQVLTLRKIVRRAVTARAVQVEALEALLPAASVTPARRAARRMEGPSGPGAGLRPVLAASPAMQAVRPQVVEPSDAPAPSVERAVDRASRRARPSSGVSLFSSPVVGAPPRSSARIVRSAMGMVRGGRRPAPSRLSGVERVPPTDRATRRTRPSVTARPPSAAGASASSSDGGPGPSGPGEAAARSVEAPGPVEAARRVAGAPRPSFPGAPPMARVAPEGEPELPLQARARVQRASAGIGPAVEADLQEETALGPVARAPRRPARSSERAFERLALVEPVDDAQEEGLSADGDLRAERARRWEAAVAPFALTRSPRGVFVPATTLARPEAAPSQEAPSAAGIPQTGASARVRSVPTPSQRATYVEPVASSATVAPRARPTARLARRVPAVSSRPGSLLPVLVPESPQGPRRAPAWSVDAPTRRRELGLPPSEGVEREVLGRAFASALDRAQPARPSRRIVESPRASLPTMSARGEAEPASAPEARPRPVRPVLGSRSPVEAAVERSVQAPLTATAARRVLAQAAAAQGAPVAELPVERMLELSGQPVFFTRRRASPLAYARRLGRPDVRVEWVEVPADNASARAAGPSAVAPAPARPASGVRPQGVRALDALDLRALATAEWVGAFDENGVPSVAGRGAPTGARPLGVASAGALLRPLPAGAVVLEAPEMQPDARAGRDARASRRGLAGAPGEVRSSRSLVPASAWAGQRSRRAAARSLGVSARPQPPRGRFDMLGVYRPPSDGAPGTSSMNLAAPMSSLTRGVAAVEPPSTVSPAGLRPGLPGGASVTGPAARPSLGVTLGAVDQGVTSSALPNWAQRASGEPRVRNETQFIEALARASEPEEILRVIYQRAARGNMTTAATGLPAPVIQVIEQIRAVAGAVEVDAGAAARGGPASDAEVVARSGVRSAAPRSTARVARGMSSLRGRGTAARRDGVGADKISKLSKKLQQLILLAEAQRQAARQQVRMAEDSAAARSEGHAAPTGGEGGNDRRVDIEALGREVLEVVSQELESRRVRSQEGSDEYGWW